MRTGHRAQPPGQGVQKKTVVSPRARAPGVDLENGSVMETGTRSLAVGFDSVGMDGDSLLLQNSRAGVGGGGSAVSGLWSQASQCENHPLKLMLADSEQDVVYYLPAKKKDNSVVMQRKIDRQKREAERAHMSQPHGTSKVSASKKVEFLLPKKVVPKGKQAEIEEKLLGRFKGLAGQKEKEMFIGAVEKRKAAEERARILKKHPHAFDKPPEDMVEEGEEGLYTEDFGGLDENAEEEDFDLNAYNNDLWADSGSAFVRKEKNKAKKQILLTKRLLVAMVLAYSTTTMTNALQEMRLKRTLVAHLWNSDRYMHAVGCVQRAFFRFRARKHPHKEDNTHRHRERRNSLIDGSLHHAGYGENAEERRELHRRRMSGATQIIAFLREVEKCLAFKLTINRYCISIRRLQGLLRRHFMMNRARLDALNKIFDIFVTAIVSHAQVLDSGKGLDMPNMRKADKLAVMRGLHKGVSKYDESRQLIAKMKTPAFHTFFRDSSVHKDMLHHISFQTKLGQGRYMTDEGGNLINRNVRNRILADFVLKKRKRFVKELTARLLNKGIEAIPGGEGEGGGGGDGADSDEEIKIVSGFHVTEDKVKQFLLQSESKEDLLAAEMGKVVELVEQAKKDYAAQKKIRHNNLSCETTWTSFLKDLTVREMTHMFIQCVEVTAKEKADREAAAAEREAAAAEAAEKRKKQVDAERQSSRRGSISGASNTNSTISLGSQASGATGTGTGDYASDGGDRDSVRGSEPTPSTLPKPSGLMQMGKGRSNY